VTTTELTPVLVALQAGQGAEDVADVLDAAAELLGKGVLDPAIRILETLDVTRLGIVASGALAGLPLAALSGAEGCLAEVTTVEYLVGARTRRSVSPAAGGSALAVVDPSEGLRFAGCEVAAVRRYASDVSVRPRTPGSAAGC